MLLKKKKKNIVWSSLLFLKIFVKLKTSKFHLGIFVSPDIFSRPCPRASNPVPLFHVTDENLFRKARKSRVSCSLSSSPLQFCLDCFLSPFAGTGLRFAGLKAFAYNPNRGCMHDGNNKNANLVSLFTFFPPAHRTPRVSLVLSLWLMSCH